MPNKQLGMEKIPSVTLLLPGSWDQKYQQYVKRLSQHGQEILASIST